MDYKTLGRTGVKVSSLCFGTATFAREADEETSIRMFNRCRDAGINFFDTADQYGSGAAEEILRKCIAHCRDKVILSTKVGNPVGDEINNQGLSRRHIIQAINNSLKRLGTDYIDLYFLHIFDSSTSIEETIGVLDDLRRQGKILYIGVSNWAAWQIAIGLGISEIRRLARIECIQPMYNLLKRQAEVEIFPLAKEKNIGVITYSPLAGGLLTGKYTSKDKVTQGRFLEQEIYVQRYAENTYYSIAENFVKYARNINVNPAALAVAWVMTNSEVTTPIIGARNLTQLEQALGSLKIKITPEMYQEISSLSISPPIATDRSEEKIE